MTKPAAISAQLVDMRNVGAHKSLKLTLHVPEEYALHAIEAFGWPTGANPVPVALARLRDSQDAAVPPSAAGETVPELTALDGAASPSRSKQRKPVAPEKRLAQQAGICCADPRFQLFLGISMKSLGWSVFDEETASEAVRRLCGVDTRADIVLGSEAGEKWEKLYGKFLGWRDHDMPAGTAA